MKEINDRLNYLKSELKYYKSPKLSKSIRGDKILLLEARISEIEKLKEDLAIYKGISEGKDIIIKKLEEEIRLLKQYAEISKNDKQHRKGLLNKALEEIKELKNK
jgi:hypothetical protein